MKLLQKTSLIFVLALMGYIFFNVAPAARGFHGGFAAERLTAPDGQRLIGPKGRERMRFSILMSKIDKEQWTIGLRYSADCPAEFRQKEAELKEMIVECLRAWLKPIRDMKPGLPITDDFRFVRHKDFPGDLDPEAGEVDLAARFPEIQAVDVSITFEFEGGAHSVALLGGVNPEVYIRRANRINFNKLSLFYTIMHELGHTFGLGDTYTDFNRLRLSTGGWKNTWGMQPTSRMALFCVGNPPGYPCEDDVRGIQWMYKNIYEGLAREDCFFSDYVFEEETGGCRPKYPFIFEIKHPSASARSIIDPLTLLEDPTIDVNARDNKGMTALHYAVIYDDAALVKDLLALENIKPFLRDKQGRTALKLARDAKHHNIVALLRNHPLTSRVDLAQTLTATWGDLKIDR